MERIFETAKKIKETHRYGFNLEIGQQKLNIIISFENNEIGIEIKESNHVKHDIRIKKSIETNSFLAQYGDHNHGVNWRTNEKDDAILDPEDSFDLIPELSEIENMLETALKTLTTKDEQTKLKAAA